MSVAELCGGDNREEMHTVYDQSEAQKYVSKICLEHNEMCGQCVCVRAEAEESNVCGPSEVSSVKSRSRNNTRVGGTYAREGSQLL